MSRRKRQPEPVNSETLNTAISIGEKTEIPTDSDALKNGSNQQDVDDKEGGKMAIIDDLNNQSEIPVIKLHFVSSHRSKDGKSFFVKTAAHYCGDKGKPIILVDCDRTNPDVSNAYTEARIVYFSENQETENYPDAILEWASENNLPALINLPGGIHELVTAWIDRTLVPIIKENASLQENENREVDLKIYNWFLCNGEQASLNLFIDSLNHFGGCVQHILVRNWGMTNNWKIVDESTDLEPFCKSPKDKTEEEIATDKGKGIQLVDSHGLPIKKAIQIDFPALSSQEGKRLAREEVKFAQAILRPEQDGLTNEGKKAWPLWERQRVINFLKKASAVLDNTGLL
ncbi:MULTISPECIES: hypothetical protein [Aerosakkonema]|uniref:hypothetical protein n=1 Tax=Aerosakkonema TaxID=1246629 RepID=UPI0035BACB2D